MLKTAIFIGQAPPKTLTDLPFGRTRLYQWFESIGISKETAATLFAFDALSAEFPGSGKSGHLPPGPQEMARHLPLLLERIDAMPGGLVVPVGKMAIHAILETEMKLEEAVGQKFTHRPFGKSAKAMTIIPLPHPSGASTWHYKPDNKQRLEQALQLIKQHIPAV